MKSLLKLLTKIFVTEQRLIMENPNIKVPALADWYIIYKNLSYLKSGLGFQNTNSTPDETSLKDDIKFG